jgi:MFS transporter, ACS family, hexuronate transporter
MENTVVYPKFRFIVGIAATLAWINIGWVIVGFAPLLTFISDEFNVPLGMVMILVMSLNALAGGTSVILCGPLVDKYGPRKVLFVSAILLVAYSLLIPYFAHNIYQVMALRVLAGVVGHGPLFAGKAALAQRWFPRKEQGTWIGIWNSGFAVGVAALYLTYYPLLKHYEGEWRDVGAWVVVPSALLAILMFITLFGKEPPMARRGGLGSLVQNPEKQLFPGDIRGGQRGGPADFVKKDFAIALKLPVLWAGAILLGLAQGVMQSINGLTASYLMAAKPLGLDWRPDLAGAAMTFIQYGMIVSGFLIGVMLVYIFRGSYKWQASTTFFLAGLAAICLTSAFATAGLGHMKICFLAVGFMMNIGYPVVTAFTAANYPPHILGKVFGVCGGISVYMGAFLSGVAGWILDKTHTFTAVYAFILAIGIVACIVAAIFLNPVTAYKREPVASGGGHS